MLPSPFIAARVMKACIFSLIFVGAITAQAKIDAQLGANTPGQYALPPASGCSAEIRGNRPKIYIANFLVAGGKKDLGKTIGDYIAQRFETDGRFELISRSAVDEEMKPLFKKKPKPEVYLQTTVDLAAAQKADCVIFGRVSKKGRQVSFLVRMASVESGENLRKVDTDVEKAAASKFLEGVGDSFVSYFVDAPPPPVNPAKKEADELKGRHFYAAMQGVSAIPFGFVRNGFSWATGGSGEFGIKGLFHKDLLFGVNGEYIYYFKNNDSFTSLYGASALGLAGYEFLNFDKVHFQLVLYGGYQFGRLVGAVESTDYGYGIFMAGTRCVYDMGKRFGMMVESRYALAVAGSTTISSVAFSLGGQWRF